MVQDQQALIEALLPYYQTPQFDRLFAQWSESLTRNQQFLLKMELNRLFTACERIIDLRPRVSTPCHEYQHAGRIHYLDDLAIEVFEQQCRAYKDRYTFGVYEAVIDFERYRPTRLANEEQQDDAETKQPRIAQVDLSEHAARSSERSYVSLEVRVELVTGRRASGTIVDISAGGARLRLPSYLELIADETLLLHFEQWQQQISFAIVGIDKKGNEQMVRLRCLATNDSYLTQIDRLLLVSRGKQRLDMELASQISLKHALQHACINSLPHLPLFISQTQNGPELSHVLQTDANQQTVAHWYWNDRLQLSRLFPQERLAMLAGAQEIDDLLLCFQLERGGQRHAYAALASELEQHGLAELFITFGSRQRYWQLFQLRAVPLDPALAERPSPSPQLPEHGFQVPSALAPDVAAFSHMIQLTPLTQELCQQYGKQALSQQSPNALSRFWLKPATVHEQLIRYQFLSLRQEPRFLHRSDVSLTLSDGSEIAGTTRNFSSKGMQVELQQPLHCAVGEAVQLSLDELQPITKKTDLSRLPYIVLALSEDGTVVRLSIDDAQQPHTGEQFFVQLIDANRRKLRELPPIHRLPPMAEALANLYASVFGHLVLLLTRQGNSLLLRHLVTAGEMPKPLAPLEPHPKGAYIRPAWLGANLLQGHLLPAWRNIKVGQGPQQLYLNDLLPDTELQVTVSEPGSELQEMLADELAFIGNQARHRARELDALINSLALVVDVMPNTQEKAFRQRWLPAGDSVQ